MAHILKSKLTTKFVLISIQQCVLDAKKRISCKQILQTIKCIENKRENNERNEKEVINIYLTD